MAGPYGSSGFTLCLLPWLIPATAPASMQRIQLIPSSLVVGENSAIVLACVGPGDAGQAAAALSWTVRVPGMNLVASTDDAEVPANRPASTPASHRGRNDATADDVTQSGDGDSEALSRRPSSPQTSFSEARRRAVAPRAGVVKKAAVYADGFGTTHSLFYGVHYNSSSSVLVAKATPTWDGAVVTCSADRESSPGLELQQSVTVRVLYIRALVAGAKIVNVAASGGEQPSVVDCATYVRSRPNASFYWTDSDSQRVANGSVLTLGDRYGRDGARPQVLHCTAVNPETNASVRISVVVTSTAKGKSRDNYASSYEEDSPALELVYAIDGAPDVATESSDYYESDTYRQSTTEEAYFVEVDKEAVEYVTYETWASSAASPPFDPNGLTVVAVSEPYADLTTAGMLFSRGRCVTSGVRSGIVALIVSALTARVARPTAA